MIDALGVLLAVGMSPEEYDVYNLGGVAMAGFVGGDIIAAHVSPAFSAKYFISNEWRIDEGRTPTPGRSRRRTRS